MSGCIAFLFLPVSLDQVYVLVTWRIVYDIVFKYGWHIVYMPYQHAVSRKIGVPTGLLAVLEEEIFSFFFCPYKIGFVGVGEIRKFILNRRRVYRRCYMWWYKDPAIQVRD